jgi:hypothetical protein
MSADWIPLRLHPEHPKVILVARLTGKPAEHVFACAVRWFRWVDQHCERPNTGLDAAALERIVGWGGRATALVQAMKHERVAWLAENDLGEMEVCEYEGNFGQCARRRHLDAKRKAGLRDSPQGVRKTSASKADARPQSVRFKSGQNAELQKQEQEEKEKTGDISAGSVAEAVKALDRWSSASRGFGLRAAQNETRKAEEWADALLDAPPVIRNGEHVGAALLVPQAVLVLGQRGAEFKNVRYALACVEGLLDEWRRGGVPGVGGAMVGASAQAAAEAAVARRQERLAQREAS